MALQGYTAKGHTMDQATRWALVERYRLGYDAIAEALRDITEAELDAREAPGEWSPREVIHHLADSEMTSAIRLRRLIVEENPEITGYDQEAFARRLFYDRPLEPSLAAFRAARESTAAILDRLIEEDWARQGTHSESGTYSVSDWLEIYAVHAHDHADQIRRARASAQRA
jgi:DinB superfamily